MKSPGVPFSLAVYFVFLIVGAFQFSNQTRGQSWKALTPLPFQEVQIRDAFWSPRIETNRTATIEANLRQCEVTGRINNFAVAGKLVPGKHEGQLYNDSDVYKMIEGIAYALTSNRDAELERRTDAIIDKIAAAQQADGYLDTYYILVKPKERWTNIQHGHELYCAGHLMEAAVAYYQATGKRKLLDVSRRVADHIDSVFGPGKRQDTSGHEEIELALIKLYRVTKEERYRALAQFFLDIRGRADKRRLFGDVHQDHMPVREQREVVGHAVRAMYLYSGMADAAALSGDKTLTTASEAIWHDVVDRKMYVTGGIGPSAKNEGFTVPYDLPNDSAYAETCAAIGMALWNHRLFLMSGDGKYADVLEREVYNGLISGVSLSGDRFFYVNPLASKGTHHRVPWFDCSCCPTNVVRYVPAMGERVYAHRGSGIWTVLYLGNTATVPLTEGSVKLTQETNYPWDGDITITLEPKRPQLFDLHLRIPGWCHAEAELFVNDKAILTGKAKNGYVSISRTWTRGDKVWLHLPMPIERVHADPRVKADVGRVALQRGPVVYCLEGVDNAGQARNLVLPPTAKLESHFEKNLMGGAVVVVRGTALAVSRGDDGTRVGKPVEFQAVPYCLWDNRQPGPMVVWLPEKPELVEVDGEDGVDASGVRARASHVYSGDTLAALNDGIVPKASADESIPRMTWWDHKGTTEWVEYQFSQPRRLTSSAIFWFDDTGKGYCRIPESWTLEWSNGTTWRPVKLTGKAPYATKRNQFNSVTFEPVNARALKVIVKLPTDFSGGILKWKVE